MQLDHHHFSTASEKPSTGRLEWGVGLCEKGAELGRGWRQGQRLDVEIWTILLPAPLPISYFPFCPLSTFLVDPPWLWVLLQHKRIPLGLPPWRMPCAFWCCTWMEGGVDRILHSTAIQHVCTQNKAPSEFTGTYSQVHILWQLKYTGHQWRNLVVANQNPVHVMENLSALIFFGNIPFISNTLLCM